MAGHSHWANIQRKKGAVDAKRGKVFTKIVKEITVAARLGGGSEDGNPRLKAAIANAKSVSMPKDTNERAIKKGTGELEGEAWEEIVYEAYGPNGVALMIEATTDNRNRTAADVRSILNKHDGSLGQTGSVNWMFSRQGQVAVPKDGISEEKITEAALEAGADDVQDDGEFWIIIIESSDEFYGVRDALETAEIPIESAGVEMVAQTNVHLEGADAEKMLKLLGALEDNDDVQKVHANYDIDDAEMDRILGD
jgi:YebC/PmpR family DNA-binding regulatory protein